MNPLVHPNYRTSYHIANLRDYQLGLSKRGDVKVGRANEAMKAWRAGSRGRRGDQAPSLVPTSSWRVEARPAPEDNCNRRMSPRKNRQWSGACWANWVCAPTPTAALAGF